MILFDDLFIGEYFTVPNSYGVYQKLDPNTGWFDVEVVPNTGIQSRDLSWDSLVIPVDASLVRDMEGFEYYGTDRD